MSKKKKKKIFILKAQLTSAIFLLVIILISGFFIFGPKLTEMAMALTGNYSKGGTEQLTAGEWNNLATDFLDKQSAAGDSMAGPLTLPADPASAMQAATKQYVDNMVAGVSSPMTDTSGSQLRMVCGISPLTAVNTIQYDSSTLRTDINTSAAGFTSVNFYYASLSAAGGSHYKITSANSIYNPSTTGFRLYLHFDDYNNNQGGVITVANALSFGWTINWCGIGN